MILPNDKIQLGEIYREHGIKGLCKVFMYSGTDTNLSDEVNYFLEASSGQILSAKIEEHQPFKRYFLVKFDCFSNPEQVQEFRKAKLWIQKKDLADADGEKYDFEWQGYQAVNPQGQTIGQIVDVSYTPSKQFVLEVNEEEVLVPYVEDWIGEIDDDKRTIVLDIPEGLISC